MAFLPDSRCASVTKLTPKDKTANVNSCGKECRVKTSLEVLRALHSSVNQQAFNQRAHLTLYAEGFAVYEC